LNFKGDYENCTLRYAATRWQKESTKVGGSELLRKSREIEKARTWNEKQNWFISWRKHGKSMKSPVVSQVMLRCAGRGGTGRQPAETGAWSWRIIWTSVKILEVSLFRNLLDSINRVYNKNQNQWVSLTIVKSEDSIHSVPPYSLETRMDESHCKTLAQ
jgi:hypothetical protein